jgi:hypothetical protein
VELGNLKLGKALIFYPDASGRFALGNRGF